MTERRLSGTLHSFLMLLLLALPATAQQTGTGVLGMGSGPGIPATAVTSGVSVPTDLDRVLAKLDAGETLTQAEFLIYLRGVEARPANRTQIATSKQETRSKDLPAQGWALVGTRLHSSHYGADRRITICGIDLFRNGSENKGWEKIDPLRDPSPKFLTNTTGEKVDIAHAHAGVAALVMRNSEISGTLMGNVNTGWGDSVQVWSERISSAKTLLGGVFTLDGDDIDEAGKKWDNARNYKPPDQVRGNELGNEARDYLQDHRTADLSEAYEYAFRRVNG